MATALPAADFPLPPPLLLLVGLGVALYTLYGALYRLVLSPVAKFPGPKLAALTFWYEFYFDVIKGGAYVYEIERMHEKYGPIVRINPYELHVKDNDLEWMNRLYPSVGREVDKFWWSAGMFGSVEMTFGTIPHDLHRIRRAAFGKFFSTAAVRRLEPALQALVDSMCFHIEEGIRAGKTVNIMYAYSALTQDVVTEYCFATSRGVVDMPDFAPSYFDSMQAQCRMTTVIKQFPWLLPTLKMLPDFWVKATSPLGWEMRLQEREYLRQVENVASSHAVDHGTHQTVFHELHNAAGLPSDEKTTARLVAEATSIVGAGTLTTAHTLTLTTYFVLNEPAICKRLMKELLTVMPDRSTHVNFQILERLPYLTAVIDEGLRMSYGVMHRLTRVQPQNALHYNGWTIPPNTPVGMTPYLLHTDPAIFPNPATFDPERWLDTDPRECERRRKYLFNFGKGSRQCAGMRLAYAELYLAIASVVRKFGDRVKLFETEYARDVKFVQDYFIPAQSPESRGVRIVGA